MKLNPERPQKLSPTRPRSLLQMKVPTAMGTFSVLCVFHVFFLWISYGFCYGFSMVFLVFPSGRWPKPTSHLWRCSNCFYDVGLEDEQYHEKKHNIYIYPNNYLCYFEDFWSILIHCSCLIFRKFLEKKHQPNHEWPLNFWMIHWPFHRFALVFWRILHDSHYVPQILHRLSWLDVDFPYVFHSFRDSPQNFP